MFAVLGVVLCAAAVGLTTQATADRASYLRSLSWSPDGGQIVFVRGEHPTGDIYAMQSDSLAEKALTSDGESSLGESAWSRDGTRILFLGGRWPVTDLFTMRADGSDRKRITKTESVDYLASWSPDGSRIVFASNRDVNMRVFVTPAAGGEAIAITDRSVESTTPWWSPDGQRVVFSSSRDGNSSIYVCGADGSGVTRLTDDAREDTAPRWSPDGKRILFVRGKGSEYDVYSIRVDGGGVQRWTEFRTPDPSPRWSPKANEFLLHHDDDIYVINMEGKVERVTDGAGHSHDATWSPDGNRIAFVYEADSLSEIQMITVHTPPPPPAEVTVAEEPVSAEPAPVESPATEPAPADVAPESTGGTVPAAREAPATRDPLTDLQDNPPAEPPVPVRDEAAGRHIRRAIFTTAVVDREPVDAIERLENDTEQVYFYTEIVDFAGRTVTHRWRYNGEIRSEVSFEVRGIRWRSYSRKRLLPSWKGKWTVEVIDDSGSIMYEASFMYEEKRGT